LREIGRFVRSFVRGFAPDFCVIDAEIFTDVHGVVVYLPFLVEGIIQGMHRFIVHERNK